MIKAFDYKTEIDNPSRKLYTLRDDRIRLLRRHPWEVGYLKGRTDTFFILPGFYVEITSPSKTPIRAVGEEHGEEQFRKNLEELLKGALIPA